MAQLNGLGLGLHNLSRLSTARTRSICAENPTGEKGKGGSAIPNPAEPKPAASARAADTLGQGWKVRPFIRLNAGQTAVLMDVGGPGIIQHILVSLHVEDLADELGVQAQLEDVQDFALQHQRELLDVGSVDQVATNRGQPGGGELVDLAPADQAEVVGLLDLCL